MSAARHHPDSASCIRSATGRRGVTLLELLLAVTLASGLLISVNFIVLSMGELWGGGSESRLFDRHVRGVTRFLESLVQQSVVPQQDATRPSAGSPPQVRYSSPRRQAPVAVAMSREPVPLRARLVELVTGACARLTVAADVADGMRLGGALGLRVARILVQAQGPDLGGRGRLPSDVRNAGPDRPPRANGGSGTSVKPRADDSELATTGVRFRFDTPSGYSGSPPMLMFEVDEAPGQCVWPERPLPQVECALQVDADEGLVLLWKSKLEEDYGKARPRKTQLSPFARSISFDYYDSERKTWTHSEQPQSDGNNGWLVPQRVRVSFVYQGLQREVSITLPDVPGGAPLR
jgi:hypothetical protein